LQPASYMEIFRLPRKSHPDLRNHCARARTHTHTHVYIYIYILFCYFAPGYRMHPGQPASELISMSWRHPTNSRSSSSFFLQFFSSSSLCYSVFFLSASVFLRRFTARGFRISAAHLLLIVGETCRRCCSKVHPEEALVVMVPFPSTPRFV